MGIKKSVYKICGYICGILTVVLIVYIMGQILIELESSVEVDKSVYKDSFSVDGDSEQFKQSLFYLLSAIFAGFAGIFVVLSILSKK